MTPVPNPFFFPGPIKEKDHDYFFGRQQQLETAISTILAKKESVAVIGGTLLGRTSFLERVAAILKARVAAIREERIQAILCIHFDCTRGAKATPEELHQLLLAKLQQELERSHPELAAPLPTAIHSFTEFREIVERLAHQHQIRCVFLLDRFHSLVGNEQVDAEFFDHWRGLTTEADVSFCTVTTVPLPDLVWPDPRVRTSPFWNYFAPMPLQLFRPGEAKTLLQASASRGGVDFDDTLIEFLVAELAGPHPLLLQIAGSCALMHCRTYGAPVDAAGQKSIREDFEQQAETYWKTLWGSLGPAEQKYVALLGVHQSAGHVAVQQLSRAGLIYKDGVGKFWPLSRAFRCFISRQKVEGVLQAPPVLIDCEEELAWVCDTDMEARPLDLEPQQFKLLECLVRHAGKPVSRDTLLTYMRSGAGIDVADLVDPDSSLKTPLRLLRKELGEKVRERIIARHGHLKFIADGC